MSFLVWKKEVMDAGRTADMSVLYQSRGCWLHQRLEELQKQAGLWHWSASSPHLPHELELLDYMSREPCHMGLKFPVVQIWSLPKAYPDVDSKSRVQGCRWCKRQMLASWTWLDPLGGCGRGLGGWVDGEGKSLWDVFLQTWKPVLVPFQDRLLMQNVVSSNAKCGITVTGSYRDADSEQTRGHSWGRRGWDKLGE